MNDCFNFEGDAIGEALAFPGGVDGLPMTVVGELGEDGRRNGEDRGELNDLRAMAGVYCSGTVYTL